MKKIASGDEQPVLGARVKLSSPSCQVAAVAMVLSRLTVEGVMQSAHEFIYQAALLGKSGVL